MSNRSLNKVILIGNLTRDPELRYTPQGTPVCSFGLATNRTWVDANNQRQEAVEFHRIVAWQKLAELCSQLLFKGRKTYVEGRLQTRNWTSAEGQERTTTEVVIDNMIVLDSRRREGEMEGTPAVPGTPASAQTVPAPEPVVSPPSVTTPAAPAGDQDKSAKKAKPAAKAKGRKAEQPAAVPAADKPAESEEIKADDIPF